MVDEGAADIDMAAVAIASVLGIAVFGFGFLVGWLACWLVLAG